MSALGCSSCDDERQILRALRVLLSDAGFEVATAETAQEALDAVSVRPPDAAILDLILPDGNGVDITRSIREWSEMPIIVLSAVGDESEKVRALEAGADDYVTKPFGPDELIARLRAALRRTGGATAEPVLRADGLDLDQAAHRVTCRRRGGSPHADRVRPASRADAQPRATDDPPDAASGGLGTGLRGRHPGPARSRRQPPPQDRAGAEARHGYIVTDPGVGYRFGA